MVTRQSLTQSALLLVPNSILAIKMSGKKIISFIVAVGFFQFAFCKSIPENANDANESVNERDNAGYVQVQPMCEAIPIDLSLKPCDVTADVRTLYIMPVRQTVPPSVHRKFLEEASIYTSVH